MTEIAPQTRTHIQSVLDEAAARHGVRILYAAESGSRAWGFGSPDSDYDVRFIYAHPREWYLRLKEPRDVIERPLDDQLVDLGGWDIRKALRLLLKSNPALYEWLCSPIVYRDDGAFSPAARSLFERHASRVAVAHHYHSIARKQWASEIDGRERVKLKSISTSSGRCSRCDGWPATIRHRRCRSTHCSTAAGSMRRSGR
jgi:uncharacterized protein